MTTIDGIKPSHLRQQGFFNPAEHPTAHVTFVGVGGIGSFASFAAAKLGIPHITLIDPDVVEEHNMPNQMFDTSQAFDSKVEAARTNIEFLDHTIDVEAFQASITEDGWAAYEIGEKLPPLKPTGVVVSGFDSMEARQDLWNECLKYNPNVPLYIDGRLDGMQLVIYAVCPWDMDDVEQYEQQLPNDDDVPTGLCTERAIIDVGFTMAAQITRLIRHHYTGKPVPKITVINMGSNTITSGDWIKL